MAYPNAAVKLNSFTSDQAASPTTPLDGPKIDIEYGEIRRSNGEIVAFLEGSQLDSDGNLRTLTINLEHLDATLVQAIFGEAVPDLSAYEIEIGVARDAAVAAQVGAETAETNAETAETNAETAQAAAEAALLAIQNEPADLLQQFVSNATAAASTIAVNSQRLIVLTPRAFYARIALEPTHSFKFRTVDRFLPDGSTDAGNGGWWTLDEDDISSEQAGMVGDGLTATAAANSAALDAAIAFLAVTGGRLNISAGTFKLSTAAVITASSIEIRGIGTLETILSFSEATTTNGIEGTGALIDVHISELTVQDADLHGIAVIADGANKPRHWLFFDVGSNSNGGDGFHVEECDELGLDNCETDSNTGDGFSVTGFSIQTSISTCTASNNTGEGFLLSDLSSCILETCEAETNTLNGYNIEKFSGLIEGCVSNTNVLSGWLFTGNTGGTVDGVRAAMMACRATGNDSAGAGANFAEIVSTVAFVALGIKYSADFTATGGISNSDTGSNSELTSESNLFVGTDILPELVSNQYMHVRHVETSGTAGGGFTQGADRTRTLNDVQSNTITGASLATDQITLPAGSYRVAARAQGTACGLHKTNLYNITDAGIELDGSSAACTTSGSNGNDSWVFGDFTIAAEKDFELRHQCSITSSTDGFGSASSMGQEVYAEVRIWKLV